jgi:Na+/proline symporter
LRGINIKHGFSREDELIFRNSNQYIQQKYIRHVFVLFILLFALFGYTDTVYFPDSWKTLLIIRFGFVIPIFITVIILTYTKVFLKNHQIIISLSALVAGLSIAYMLILKPDNKGCSNIKNFID